MCMSNVIWIFILLIGFYFLFSKKNIKKERKESIDKDVKYYRQKNIKQNKIDKILDKINKTGYKNLSQQEKQTLKNFNKY